MKLQHTLIFGAMFAVAACTSNTASKNASADSLTADSPKVAVEIANDTTETVFSHYSALKDALVESDAKSASAAGKQLISELSKIEGCEKAATLAKNISESSDIKVQRTNFVALNADLIGVMKSADVASGNIYVMFCPMANEGKGAYWFSADKAIKNPYYGSDMLTCGEVKEEIAKR